MIKIQSHWQHKYGYTMLYIDSKWPQNVKQKWFANKKEYDTYTASLVKILQKSTDLN